jgi:hypothetical protein
MQSVIRDSRSTSSQAHRDVSPVTRRGPQGLRTFAGEDRRRRARSARQVRAPAKSTTPLTAAMSMRFMATSLEEAPRRVQGLSSPLIQRPSSRATASTTSLSVGNTCVTFFTTILPFTATSKLPEGPGISSESSFSSSFSAAAARTARGL